MPSMVSLVLDGAIAIDEDTVCDGTTMAAAAFMLPGAFTLDLGGGTIGVVDTECGMCVPEDVVVGGDVMEGWFVPIPAGFRRLDARMLIPERGWS